MKKLILFLAMVMVSQAHAQGRQDGSEAIVVPVGSIQEAQPAVTSSGNPIYIINKNKVSGSQETSQGSTQASTLGNRQGQVQEQPVSVVQDAPLKVSPAEQMRKSRQDTEAVTEDGIVQALERARMQDEIKRRDKFNNAIQPVGTADTAATTTTVVTQTQVAQPVAPPVYVQPVQAYQPVQQVVPVQQAQPIQKIHVVEEQEEVTSDYRSDDTRRDDRRDYKSADSDKTDVKAEIRAALAEQKKPDEERQTYYVAALASFGQYNNVVNVDKSLGYGVAVGTTFANRFVGEASFIYGSYNLNDMYLGSCGYGNCYPAQVDMRQYNFGVAAKYQILPGRFKTVDRCRVGLHSS